MQYNCNQVYCHLLYTLCITGIASDPDTATMFYGMSYTEMTSVNNTMAITQAVCNGR